ncbi:MAG: lipoate--protein ligase [Candidatus Adiutrix sp.]|jgi:lipoate-protein ligase A|nr:lipoate--protein ligase [Candidatus Adiutrix sp.]
MKMLYHETGSTWAPYNLAMEEALTETVRPDYGGCFLLWQNSPAVIIGRHQNAVGEVNLPELARRGITLVRRMTGGGAVYHDLGNLNFSFILPQEEGLEMRRLLQPIMDYLAKRGLQVGMEGRNDLSITGVGKFSGLASRRLPGKYQLHGTIMHEVDLGVLEHVLLVDPEKYKNKGVASVKARVANLRPFLPIDLAELWAGLKAAYGAEAAAIPEKTRQRAQRLAEDKYSQDSWNIGQGPRADIFLKKRFPFGSLELHLETSRNKISAAKITGDFLTPSNTDDQIAVEELAEALVSLPADDAESWGRAWARFELARAFHGQVDEAEVRGWLAAALA